MPITKTAVVVLASTSVPPGTAKATPIEGAAIDCRAYPGNSGLEYKITNGASAPTLPGMIMFQVSRNGLSWVDYQLVGGDLVASSVASGAITIERWVMYVRAIAYGNTVNAVTVEAHLQAVTAV